MNRLTPSAICIATLLMAGAMAPQTRAATFNVNSTAFSQDVAPGNGICADGAGRCTLRAAIMEANALAGPDTINLAANTTYTLTSPDNTNAGLPVITGDIVINGNGATIKRSQLPFVPDFRIFWVYPGNLTLKDTTITGGNGSGGGALYVDFTSKATLIRCTITENKGTSGGGIVNFRGTLIVENSTVSNNTSFDGYGGGGIRTWDYVGGSTTIVNSSIVENRATTADGFGAGRGDAIAGGPITVRNSIIGSPVTGVGDDCYAGIVSHGHNIASDSSCVLTGTGDLNNTNPLVGALANNGGLTETHALLSGSPAINAVPVADCLDSNGAPLTTDQRGIARPQAGACDIGAVERQNINYLLSVNKIGSGTVTSAPAGISCGSDCSELYPNGTVVVLTATPASGYVFAGWSPFSVCAGLKPCEVTMNAAKTVTARFNPTLAPSTTITTAVGAGLVGITNGASTPSTSITFTFTGTSFLPITGFQCKLDAGAFALCPSPMSYTALATGNHTFQVRAVNAVGMVDASPASFNWVVAPVVISPTSMTLVSSSINSFQFGKNVTLTASVTPVSATGRIAFYDGMRFLGNTPMTGGTAILNLIGLEAGIRQLRAYYAGDALHLSSTATELRNIAAVSSSSMTPAAGSPIAVGHRPVSIAAGDFNGDRIADLVVTSYTNNTITILLGNGSGGFAPAGTPVPVGASPQSVAVGDLNGDGKADLLVANTFGGTVSVLIGNGLGWFTATATLSAGTGPIFIRIADFNRDGKADFAAANIDSDNIHVYLGDGAGGFQQAAGSPLAAGDGAQTMAVEDFDGDGIADLAVTNYYAGTLWVFKGTGTGTFVPLGSPLATGAYPGGLSAADFDGDGDMDLAYTNEFGQSLKWLLNNGLGTFAVGGSPVALGANPSSTAVGDFNGDGRPDLAVSAIGNGTVTVLLWNGAGFTPLTTPFAAGSASISLVVSEFNGDGRADLAIANYSSSNVAILLGAPGPPAETKLTRPGTRTFGAAMAISGDTLVVGSPGDSSSFFLVPMAPPMSSSVPGVIGILFRSSRPAMVRRARGSAARSPFREARLWRARLAPGARARYTFLDFLAPRGRKRRS